MPPTPSQPPQYLFVALESPATVEAIYAQIVIKTLDLVPNLIQIRQPFTIHKLVEQNPERFFIFVGSSELLTGHFPVYDRLSEKWVFLTKQAVKGYIYM
jgi:5-bromo-4-chloroindolyl phosphate hydrolysis protein